MIRKNQFYGAIFLRFLGLFSFLGSIGGSSFWARRSVQVLRESSLASAYPLQNDVKFSSVSPPIFALRKDAKGL